MRAEKRPVTLVEYEGGLARAKEFQTVLREVEELPPLSLMRYIMDELRVHVPNVCISAVDIALEKGDKGWRAYVMGDFQGTPYCCKGPELRGCLLSVIKRLWEAERDRQKMRLKSVPTKASAEKPERPGNP